VRTIARTPTSEPPSTATSLLAGDTSSCSTANVLRTVDHAERTSFGHALATDARR